MVTEYHTVRNTIVTAIQKPKLGRPRKVVLTAPEPKPAKPEPRIARMEIIGEGDFVLLDGILPRKIAEVFVALIDGLECHGFESPTIVTSRAA